MDTDVEFESPETSDCEDDVNVVTNPTTAKNNADLMEISEDVPDSYEIVFLVNIVQEMDDLLVRISSIINTSKTTSRILLNKFNWNEEKLIESYCSDDRENLLSDVPSPLHGNESINDLDEVNECLVCFSTLEPAVTFNLQCAHLFCTDCWNEYLETKIADVSELEWIQCAALGCNVLVEDDKVMVLLKNTRVKEKYQRLIVNSFIESNKLLKWCLFPGCNNVTKVTNVDQKLVNCLCGHRFCFSCNENWHEPIDCFYLKKWMRKVNEDFVTLNWLHENTKNCPNCDTLNEIIFGEFYFFMECQNQDCRFEICWTCERDFYKCDKAAETRMKNNFCVDLEKSLFYFNRYVYHQQNLNVDRKLHKKIDDVLIELTNNHQQVWSEVQYLKDAVSILCSCRQTLAYTYAFSYFNRYSCNLVVFERLQTDLLRSVRSLSDSLKLNTSYENHQNIKIKILDECLRCENSRKSLLELVREGQERNLWTYEE